jgi:dTDP-3-amino-3,4,6-trideoxy-alpha-D-glucose transaminase
MTIPFLDLRAGHDEMAGELMDAIERVIQTGSFVLGPELSRFEASFASYVNAAHAIVIPVHLYGQPCAIDSIVRWADDRGVAVIEDAAQAHGARYQGRRVCAHGDLVCFSFYPGKNLGALGDGGAITTNDPELARRVRMLRNYGGLQKYEHVIVGHNSRLDEIQAAILSAKLARLDGWNARRKEIALRYTSELHGAPGLGLPVVAPNADPVWHLFVVTHPRRDELKDHLASAGIAASIHYPTPPHLTPAYRSLAIQPGSLPIAERAGREVLSLPIGPHLSDAAVDQVIREVRKFCQRSTTS